MLKIKLSRGGKKKQPVYRLILTEQHKDPWGNFLEILGHYTPRNKEEKYTLKEERIKHWLSKGVQSTDTVHNILIDAGILKDDKKRKVSSLGKKFKQKLADEKKAEKEKAAAEKETKSEAEKPKATSEDSSAEASAKEETPAEHPKAEEEKKNETPTEAPTAPDSSAEASAKEESK